MGLDTATHHTTGAEVAVDGERTAEQTDALWTQLFVDWLEEQAQLVVNELERGPVASGGEAPAGGHAARAR